MRMGKIEPYENGAHDNQSVVGNLAVIPEGWAVISDDMATENFPFGEIEVEDRTFYRDVVKTREVLDENGEVVRDEDGNAVMERYKEQEPYKTVPYVTKWTAGTIPEPEPEPDPEPTQLDILEAQVTYTAMMTDTLLEV